MPESRRKRIKLKDPPRTIDIDAPGHLNEREFAAFRLGVIKMLLAAADEFDHPIPGIFRQAYEGEIAYREYQLEQEES